MSNRFPTDRSSRSHSSGLRRFFLRGGQCERGGVKERPFRSRGKTGGRSIYDKVERVSDITKRSRDGAVRLPWRVVCLVLGLLLLYNPFFTICPAAGPAETIQHHVSYRSTIAASELGCSNLQQHPEVSVEPVVALIATLFDAVHPVEVIAPRPSEETVAASDGFVSALWSRPPPTL
jgi:hypothetical protein